MNVLLYTKRFFDENIFIKVPSVYISCSFSNINITSSDNTLIYFINCVFVNCSIIGDTDSINKICYNDENIKKSSLSEECGKCTGWMIAAAVMALLIIICLIVLVVYSCILNDSSENEEYSVSSESDDGEFFSENTEINYSSVNSPNNIA